MRKRCDRSRSVVITASLPAFSPPATPPPCASTSPTPMARPATMRLPSTAPAASPSATTACRPAWRSAPTAARLRVPLMAVEPGDALADRAPRPYRRNIHGSAYLPVRPAQHGHHRMVVDLKPGASLRIDQNCCRQASCQAPRSASACGRARRHSTYRQLLALDRYPYGCTERTTSRALPLLYVSDLSQRLPAFRR